MKPGVILGIVVVAILIAIGFYMIDFDVTDEGSMPDVDVSVEGGELPETDVEVGDVDVGTEEVTIEVPTIDVESPEEENAEEGTTNNN